MPVIIILFHALRRESHALGRQFGASILIPKLNTKSYNDEKSSSHLEESCGLLQ